MAVLFGMGVGTIYGGLFAVVVGTLVRMLAEAKPGLVAQMAGRPRFTLMATIALYLGIFYWGLVGAAFGGLFTMMERSSPQGGLGSPNLRYTLIMVGLTLLLALPAFLLVRRGRIQVAVLAAAFALAFGWLVPWLGV